MEYWVTHIQRLPHLFPRFDANLDFLCRETHCIGQHMQESVDSMVTSKLIDDKLKERPGKLLKAVLSQCLFYAVQN